MTAFSDTVREIASNRDFTRAGLPANPFKTGNSTFGISSEMAGIKKPPNVPVVAIWRQKVRNWLSASVSHDIFVNAITFVITGAVLRVTQKISELAFGWVRRFFTVTATFDSRDETHAWFLNWIEEQDYGKTNKDVAVTCKDDSKGTNNVVGEQNSWLEKRIVYTPGPGSHVFWYRNRVMWMTIDTEQATKARKSVSALTISFFGRSRKVLDDLIEETKMLSMTKDLNTTVIFSGDMYGNWQRCASRPKRAMNSVIFANGLSKELNEDAMEFLRSESWYRDRGIPYRRGYILYGPPGNGKTSYVSALGAFLNLNIYVVNVANPAFTDEILGELLSSTPSRCIVLLEDIEYVFEAEDTKTGIKSSNITFSGLLNAIDGVSSQEGRILILTTNNIGRLSPTLIRSGRIDVRAYIGFATPGMALKMFNHFYKHLPLTNNEGDRFVHAVCKAFNKDYQLDFIEEDGKKVDIVEEKVSPTFTERLVEKDHEKSLPLSMATLQGHLMKYKHSPENAIENAFQLKENAAIDLNNGTQ